MTLIDFDTPPSASMKRWFGISLATLLLFFAFVLQHGAQRSDFPFNGGRVDGDVLLRSARSSASHHSLLATIDVSSDVADEPRIARNRVLCSAVSDGNHCSNDGLRSAKIERWWGVN